MPSHVLLIHSAITKSWTVRIMWQKRWTDGMECFDCDCGNEADARRLAKDVSERLGVRMEESE